MNLAVIAGPATRLRSTRRPSDARSERHQDACRCPRSAVETKTALDRNAI